MRNKLIFIIFFVILGFVALQVPVNVLAGSRVKFTLFDLFAPVSGAFLGTLWGVLAVFLMQVGNLVLHGVSALDKGAIIRLFPTLFAVVYFASVRSKGDKGSWGNLAPLLLAVPLLSMLSFNLNPVGRSVWFYSLFWLIPILMWPLKGKFLLARALGATFTAHAVGGAVWIWAFNLPAAVWTGLVPVVILERSIFALGIAASYILMNNVLAYLSAKRLLPKGIGIDKRYVLKS